MIKITICKAKVPKKTNDDDDDDDDDDNDDDDDEWFLKWLTD